MDTTAVEELRSNSCASLSIKTIKQCLQSGSQGKCLTFSIRSLDIFLALQMGIFPFREVLIYLESLDVLMNKSKEHQQHVVPTTTFSSGQGSFRC